jgi:hypothetical protein
MASLAKSPPVNQVSMENFVVFNFCCTVCTPKSLLDMFFR